MWENPSNYALCCCKQYADMQNACAAALWLRFNRAAFAASWTCNSYLRAWKDGTCVTLDGMN